MNNNDLKKKSKKIAQIIQTHLNKINDYQVSRKNISNITSSSTQNSSM